MEDILFADRRITCDGMQMKHAAILSSKRAHGVAEAFVDKCVAYGRHGLSLAEVVRETGLSERSAKDQMRRLGRKTMRVARWQPFFLIKASAGDAAAGGPPYDRWLDDYFAWLGHPYYVGLQSAAAIHGSQPQALQTTQILTDAPRREARVGRQRLRFFVKSSCAASLMQEAPRAFAPMKVSTPETTVFDLVRYAPRIGGIARVAETISPMLHLLQPPRIKSVLKMEDEVSTTQRLGFIFDKIGSRKLASAAEECLPLRCAWIPLAVGATDEADAARNRRWHIVENAVISS